MPIYRSAPVHEEDHAGVTIAIALLLRIDGRMPFATEIERWVREIDATIVPLVGADENTPVGIAIRATERSGKGIAEDLILNAAVACPAHFEQSQDERPARTVAHFDAPLGAIKN